jgi:hypothetical protein
MLLLAALLLLTASVPEWLAYRVSVPAGRCLAASRLPLLASALALAIGVGVAYLAGGGS